MSEIYWITHLDAIVNLSIALCVIGAIGTIVSFFVFLATCDSDREYDVKIRKFFTKTFPVILIIAIPCVVFIPTTKEALVIYAVGGGLDYIKSDTTMQQMPKKVIDACDAYLDEILKDSNNKKDK